MDRFLVYNFSGELDDISHLFPNERLARIAAIIKQQHKSVTIIDRANTRSLREFGADFLKNLGELSFYDHSALYDAKLRDEAEGILQRHDEVIFLNLWHGTGFKFSMDLAAHLKAQRPALKIYGVGQKVDWFKEHILTLANNTLDGLILGLGYNVIEAIVTGADMTCCPNTISCADGRIIMHEKVAINVDDYPAGIYDQDVYQDIAYKIPLHTITLSNQACPNHCVFCVRPENYGTTNIRRDIARVFAEMRELYLQHQVRYFRFEDSTPPEHALTEIAQAIVNSELNGQITFSAFSRIDTNSTEDFALLRRAGCRALFFGIESLDDSNLLRLHKGISYAAVRETVTRAHAAGIKTIGSFIVPIPEETHDTLANTLTRLTAMRDVFDSVISLPAGVYPPTEWGKHPEAYGIQLDDDYLERFVVFPIKYLQPLKYWPAAPFSYALMGKPAAEVTFADIVAIHSEFQQYVQGQLGIPCISDYYYLVADYLRQDQVMATRQLVSLMIQRDYAGLDATLHSGNARREGTDR